MSIIKCDKCLKTFSSEKTLHTHQDKYHTIKIDIQKTESSNKFLTLDNQMLKFNDNQIIYFIHNNELYFKAKDIAKLLQYIDTKDAIKRHISDQDKFIVSYIKYNFSKLDDKAKKVLDSDQCKTIYINKSGLKSLILKSNKPNSINLADQLGISIDTKYLRKEIEIIAFMEPFLKRLNIDYILQKSVKNYKIDLYLPNHNIAIEIDEFGHCDRNQEYERNREEVIKSFLKCKFLRINPDIEKFNLASCIADLTKLIYSNPDDDKCCVCYDNNILRKLPTCNHELCDECYLKLEVCPQCRSYYGNYKLSDALFNVTDRYLDKIKENCNKNNNMNLDELFEELLLFNKLFSRTIFIIDNNKNKIWKDSCVDKFYIDNLINYREHTDIINERIILRYKALSTLNLLVNHLKRFKKHIIPIQLHNLSDDETITEKYNSLNQKLKLKMEKEKTRQILSNNDVMLQKEKTIQSNNNVMILKEKTRQLELEIEFYKLKNNI